MIRGKCRRQHGKGGLRAAFFMVPDRELFDAVLVEDRALRALAGSAALGQALERGEHGLQNRDARLDLGLVPLRKPLHFLRRPSP